MNLIRRLLVCFILLSFTHPVSVQAARLVFLIGEDEYRTAETLPDFAERELRPLGHTLRFVHADPADKNKFPGLVEALREADLLLVSVRRRTPELAVLKALREYVASGRPVLGIRTASHAFALMPKAVLSDPALGVWQEFDADVLGGNYMGHHKGEDKTSATVAPGASDHPVLKGVSVGELSGNGTLYRNTPLAKDAIPLLIGSIPGQPSEPIAWTRLLERGGGKVFYTSMGHPKDFSNPHFSRMLRNAIEWGLSPRRDGR